MTFEEFDRLAKGQAGAPAAAPAMSFEEFDAAARGESPSAGRRFLATVGQTVREGREAAEPVLTTGQKALQAVTPLGSATGAGAAAGTLAAGRLVPLARYPALYRILGGTLGGEAGGQLEGRPTGTGGALGAAGTALGEGVGALGSKLLRSLPWMKGRIAGQDAARYGETMERLSPQLAGARTAEKLRTLAAGPGQAALGAAKGEANAAVARGLEGMGTQALIIPSLAKQARAIEPIPGYAGATHAVERPVPMSLQEANDALSEIGARAFSKNPLDRTFQGVDQRQLYGRVYNEIRTALDRADPTGFSVAQFEKAQAAYKAGLALLKPLQRPNAFRQFPDEVQFNTPALQTFIANPKNEAALRNKLGDAGYQALVNALTRGGGVGARDVLPAGQGRMMDAFMQSFGRGQNTGSLQALGVPFRTLLPNVGAQYAGRAPYTMPRDLQILLDLLGQRAGSEATP